MGNVKRIFQGTTDLDISKLGAVQLEYLKKRFKYVNIDKVYSSPLKRAVKTAEAIIGDRNLEVEIDKGLIELHGGIVEGKPVEETFGKMPHLLDAWENHPQDFNPEGGERMDAAYERIWDTVLKIAKNNPNKTIACATHGGVLRCLVCRLIEKDISRLKNIPITDNTSVTLIRFDDKLNPELVLFNNTLHLPSNLNHPIGSFSKDIEVENK